MDLPHSTRDTTNSHDNLALRDENDNPSENVSSYI